MGSIAKTNQSKETNKPMKGMKKKNGILTTIVKIEKIKLLMLLKGENIFYIK
jgi:hypothetical protein